MDIKFNVEITNKIPTEKINTYTDLVVFGVARTTQDFTYSESRFPRKTGNLERSSMAQPIRKEKDMIYCLDNPSGATYGGYVWDMPQNTTNWTNPNTYSKWFATVYQNKKEVITQLAVDNALRSVK